MLVMWLHMWLGMSACFSKLIDFALMLRSFFTDHGKPSNS